MPRVDLAHSIFDIPDPTNENALGVFSGRSRLTEAERMLLIGVLKDAKDTIGKGPGKSERSRKLYQEAVEWFKYDGEQGPLNVQGTTFPWVCHWLGLNASYVRKMVLGGQ